MTADACLDETTATQLLLGTLPADIADAKEQHLLNCATCLERAQSIQAEDELVSSLRSMPQDETSPDFAPLVAELEQLGASAQIAASARNEIIQILGQPHANDELGRLLHFRILEVLGAGGMGIVFKAEDEHLKRIVALKAMRPSMATDPEAKRRFQREAMAVAAFEHDHIVTVYQVDEDQGVPCFSMQLLEGESLKERLRKDGQLPIEVAIRITREIGFGLMAAHDRGLLHRDIKPDNVWLECPQDRVKILDFGLVRSVEERSSLTHSGTILGTPEYMAPEQACGEDVDERCDLFSVGCVLYHMLTGNPPFQAKNVVATLVAISNAQVLPPHQADPSIPRPLSDLTSKLLQRDPEQRLASAHDLVRELDRISKHTIEPKSVSNGLNSRWWRSWLGAASFILVAAVIAYQTNNGTVYIDADDDVVTTIDGQQIAIKDKKTQREFRLAIGENKLRAGDYEIVVRNDDASFEFSTREFTIRRGGRKDVRIWMVSSRSAHDDHSIGANSFIGDLRNLASNSGTDENSNPDRPVPQWHAGVSNSLGVNVGQALSPLALVQRPGPTTDDFVSWTRETPEHRGGVKDMCLAAYGGLSATAGEDGTVRIWDSGKLKNILVCPDGSDGVNAVAWSHDGKLIAASTDKSITIWSVEKRRPQFHTRLQRNANQLAWFGNVLAFSDADGVHLWTDGELPPNTGMTGKISKAPWSPHGTFLACLERTAIRIWDVTNRKVHATIELEETSEEISYDAPAFSPHHGYFVFRVSHYRASRDDGGRNQYRHSELLIYDVENAARIKTIRLGKHPQSYTWDPSGDAIVYVNTDGVYSHDLNSGKVTKMTLPQNVPIATRSAARCGLGQGERANLYVVDDGNAWILDNAVWKRIAGPNCELEATMSGDYCAIRCFTHGDRDGNGYLRSTLEVWDRRQFVKVMQVNSDDVTSFSLSPNSDKLCVVRNRNSFEIYDLASSKRLAESELTDSTLKVDWSDTGDYLIAMNSTGLIVFDGTSGAFVKEVRFSNRNGFGGRGGTDLCWSADGKQYAMPKRGTEVAAVIVDLESDQELRTLRHREMGGEEVAKQRLQETIDDLNARREQLGEQLTELENSIVERTARQGGTKVALDWPSDLKKLTDDIIAAKFHLNDAQTMAAVLENFAETDTTLNGGIGRSIGWLSTLMSLELAATADAKRLAVQQEALQLWWSSLMGGRNSPEYQRHQNRIDELKKELSGLGRNFTRANPTDLRNTSAESRQKKLEDARRAVNVLQSKIGEWHRQLKHRKGIGNSSDQYYLDVAELLLTKLDSDLNIAQSKQLDRLLKSIAMLGRSKGRTQIETVGMAWSPNGQFVAMLVSNQNSVRSSDYLYIWDLTKPSDAPQTKLLLERQPSSRRRHGLFFSPNSQQLAIPFETSVMFVDVQSTDRLKMEFEYVYQGLGWVGNDCFTFRVRDGIRMLSPVDESITELRCERPRIVDDQLYAVEANTIQVWGADRRLQSNIVVQHRDGVTQLNEIAADGVDQGSGSPLPIVGLNQDGELEFQQGKN